ncbi:MAG: sulfotransferase [Pseudomonadales bacterium]|nr:sulfotransferase [Pseudomonadales bacterium]MBO6563855.1 sulfotransferase [Pseudomonadales bacterium]MBO6596971.1 sulfotransferase [Pseudomonadales bacterium]MBO6703613.1 sulfotransferase [Pseudomonadales bacterium]MBO6823843.1 sulfotransferase [Pseudomonadales bacterium]
MLGSTTMLYTREKILSAARFTTGLDDFGTDDFIEPLDLLIEDYHTSAKLNRKGVWGSWIYLHRMLSNRLRLNHYLATTPAEAQVIQKPIFILGLPRTGSTMLHELLASHPDLRAPSFWEASFVPGYSLGDKGRQWITSAQIGIVDLLAPGFRSVHNLGTHLPHECITMQALSLRTMQFHAAHNIQKYHQWLETCDWEPAYIYHQKYLKWLQFGDLESRRWVLKAPGHLLSLANLMQRYPDARIIHLHRNPLEVIPSMGSLFLHLRRPFTREVNLNEIGKDVSRQWHKGLADSLAWRQTHPENDSQFLDLDYRELITDPVASAEKILAFAEVSIDNDVRQRLNNYIANNPKGKHGTHRYSLNQFGLDGLELADLFSEYNSHFSLTNTGE